MNWRHFSRRLLGSRGRVGLLCLGLDVLLWFAIYRLLPLLYAGFTEGDSNFQASVAVLLFVVVAGCLFIIGGYDGRTRFMSLGYMSEHCITLLAAGCVGGLLIYAGSTFNLPIHPSRGVVLASLIAFAPLSLICRRGLGQLVEAQATHTYFLVLGAGELARHLARSNRASAQPQRLRFIYPDLAGTPTDPLLPGTSDPDLITVEHLTFGQFADYLPESCGVVLATEGGQIKADLVEWLTRLHYEDIPVYTLETFYERHWRRVPTYAIEPTWPLQMGTQLVSSSPYSHAKRLFDMVAAGVGLFMLSPVFLVLALLVLVESGRPVFFCQQRVGRNRRPFSLYKFRSMYVRAPGEEGSLYTDAKDNRITRVGAWLRKLRLDELPQLWNVLCGDMSLIGPRAEWDQLVDRYERLISCYHFRHLVKPGITGWAQVSYPYGASAEDAEQKLKYDLYYIRHYSLRLDAMIVLKTLHIMLWGKGQ